MAPFADIAMVPFANIAMVLFAEIAIVPFDAIGVNGNGDVGAVVFAVDGWFHLVILILV